MKIEYWLEQYYPAGVMENNILRELQRIVNRATQEILQSTAEYEVKQFGSRVYGAAGPSSDWDFYMELSEEHAPQEQVIGIRKDQTTLFVLSTFWRLMAGFSAVNVGMHIPGIQRQLK